MRLSRRALVSTASATLLAAPFVLRKAALGADPIKVVGIHDASGGLDIYGQPMIDCLTLAAEEINAGGGLLGRPIELIHYDPQSSIQLYTQFATQAATRDRAAVVHGGITSASREAIRPVLRRYGTLYFYNTQYEGGVCDRNIFCLGSGPAQNVAKLVPHVMGRWGRKVCILAADYNYGQITSKWVTKYVREGGGEVVAADFFPLDVTDFGPTIKKIQAAKPDMVMSVLVGGAHIAFYRQWAAAGMKQAIPMASTTFGVGNEHVVLTPEEGDGIAVAFAYFQELATPANQAFVKTYKERFGGKAGNVTELAMQTYVAMKVWAEGVARAGTTERLGVIQALEQGSSFAGPGGTMTLDPRTHHAVLDVHVAEAGNRAFKVLGTFPQQAPADTQSVCDLVANPDANQQFVVDVRI
jgi:urea transport system substrate-binding protein